MIPTTGMLGKDPVPVMDGVDYGGVEVKSFGFENPKVALMQKHGSR